MGRDPSNIGDEWFFQYARTLANKLLYSKVRIEEKRLFKILLYFDMGAGEKKGTCDEKNLSYPKESIHDGWMKSKLGRKEISFAFFREGVD